MADYSLPTVRCHYLCLSVVAGFTKNNTMKSLTNYSCRIICGLNFKFEYPVVCWSLAEIYPPPEDPADRGYGDKNYSPSFKAGLTFRNTILMSDLDVKYS